MSEKSKKNAAHKFWETNETPKMTNNKTFSEVQNPTILNEQWQSKIKQILTFETLEPVNVWLFCLINYLNHKSTIKIVFG